MSEQPTPSFADTITAARETNHLAHCANCPVQSEATAAAITENGASMARRDRLTLGLRATTQRRRVQAVGV